MPERSPGAVSLPPPAFPLAGLFLGWLADRTLSLPTLPDGAWPAGAFLVVLGVALLGWSILAQSAAGTSPDVRRPTTALVVTGPYRFSRNPIYLGFLVVQAGAGLWTGWWLATVLVPLAGWGLSTWIIRREEAWLSAHFPDYDAYRDRVPRWF